MHMLTAVEAAEQGLTVMSSHHQQKDDRKLTIMM